MAGITRFDFGEWDGRGSYRKDDSLAHESLVNGIYRECFRGLGLPLEPGEGMMKGKYAEFLDRHLGIDVVLRTEAGPIVTLQEKVLFVDRSRLPGGAPTLTVEVMNDPDSGVKGDWYSLAAQYYFVAYDYGYRGDRVPTLHDWILVDWPALLRSHAVWVDRENGRDGASASFRYLPFSSVPPACIIRSKVRYTPGGQWSLPFYGG